MVTLRNVVFSTLMFLPLSALAAVCESIYDGDKAVSIVQGTPENYTLSLINNSSSASDVTHSQLQAVYNAKEKIQRVVGIYPKFVICGDAEPNAFAFEQQDGAVVGVSVGMLKLLDGDEDMAAAVIGHEIAHHTQNHRLRTQQSELVTNIISSLIGLYIEARVQQTYRIKGVGTNVAAIGSVLTISKFSRDHEREADEVGFRYMLDAGYNPEASIRLAEALLSKGSRGTGLFYDTHPSWDERAARFKTLIAGNSKAQQIIVSRNSEKLILASRELPVNSNKKYEALNSSFQLSDSQKSFNEAVAAINKRDIAEAVKLLKISSKLGNSLAQINLGFIYAKGAGVDKDNNEAVRLFRLAAEQGDALGQCNLGFMYQQGAGVEKDNNEAVRLFRLAADQGNALAQSNLGFMFAKGTGVAKDEKEAVRLYRLAAEQGDAMAQNNLGFMYATGIVVTKDDKEAERLFRLAADQGNAPGQRSLGFMYEQGIVVSKNGKEAVRLYRLAANQGDANAQIKLGLMYANGIEVAKDNNEAVRLFRLAADQGNPLGQGYLGLMYEHGTGIKKDINEALRLYRLAADQGDANAQINLGLKYEQGAWVAKDDMEAVRLFRLAAEQGSAMAQNNLGFMYENGKGVDRNLSEAVAWYRLAAAQGLGKAITRLKQMNVPLK